MLAFSSLQKTFFVLTFVILLVTLKLLERTGDADENVQSRSVKRWTEARGSGAGKQFLKVFHLDLKGAPPRVSYLLSALPLVRRAGANAILVEYEDMFPFWGRLRNVSAANAYSAQDVRRLVSFAGSLNMEVIPLVQTFGHLEYVLKLREFRHLREVDSFPQEICPMNREAVQLVKEMVLQVMTLHVGSRYVHIGCDEIRHLGECPRCFRNNHKQLFSRHVNRIADYVRNKFPGVIPLIWDDMLRRWPFTDLANSGLGTAVEPVVWVYGSNIFALVPPFVWNIYRTVFPRIWAASAFKGAFGERELLPDLSRHLANHLSWNEVFRGNAAGANFSGIVLTGWSRYDHFAVLCELLPVSIPSLVLGLVFLESDSAENPSKGFSKWLGMLGCPNALLPEGGNETLVQDALGDCSFLGSRLYSAFVDLLRLRKRLGEVKRIMSSSGWTSRYNFRRNFTSSWRLVEMFPGEGFAGEELRRAVSAWKERTVKAMEEFFERETVEEWEEQNVRPMEEKLDQIRRDFVRLMKRKAWPRRPLQ